MNKCRFYLEGGIFYKCENQEWFVWDSCYEEWQAIEPPKNKSGMLEINKYNDDMLIKESPK